MATRLRQQALQRSSALAHKITDNRTTNPVDHARRVKKELMDMGLSWLGLGSMEARYLPTIIHTNEHLGGVVYGRSKDGRAMLVATDRRVIYIDKKPLFENEDEISYDVVSGVSYGHSVLGSTVTLHTRVKDYPLKTTNRVSAEIFIRYIEMRCLEHLKQREGHYD